MPPYDITYLGNLISRTDANGQLLSTHWFDAHGTEQTTPSTEPFGYKGQFGYYTDRETGLILCTHRYLDPESGRWLTRDPLGFSGGVNLYSYCGNRVTVGADPSGCFIVPVVLICVAVYAWYKHLEYMSDHDCGAEDFPIWVPIGGAIEGGAAGYRWYTAGLSVLQVLAGEGCDAIGDAGDIAGGVGGAPESPGTGGGGGPGAGAGGVAPLPGAGSSASPAAPSNPFAPGGKYGDFYQGAYDYLGPGCRIVQSGDDLVMIGADNQRRIKFYIDDPSPHPEPHLHIVDRATGRNERLVPKECGLLQWSLP